MVPRQLGVNRTRSSDCTKRWPPDWGSNASIRNCTDNSDHSDSFIHAGQWFLDSEDSFLFVLAQVRSYSFKCVRGKSCTCHVQSSQLRVMPDVDTRSYLFEILCRYLSFMYWTYSLLVKIEFSDREVVDCNLTNSSAEDDIATNGKCVVVLDVTRVLSLPRSLGETPLLEVGVLFGMLLVFRYVVYLVLWKKTRTA